MKLDNDNYLIWKQQMLNYITTYGLEGLIDGNVVKLSHLFSYGSLNSSFFNWTKLTRCLLGGFTVLCQEVYHVIFFGKETTYEQWIAL